MVERLHVPGKSRVRSAVWLLFPAIPIVVGFMYSNLTSKLEVEHGRSPLGSIAAGILHETINGFETWYWAQTREQVGHRS